MNGKIILAFILSLLLFLGNHDVVQSQKFETNDSETFFDKADHSPQKIQGGEPTVKDIVEEATGAVTNKVDDGQQGAKGFRSLVKILRNYALPFLLVLAVASFMLLGIRLVISRKDADSAWKERMQKSLWRNFL